MAKRPSLTELQPCPHRNDEQCTVCAALERLHAACRAVLVGRNPTKDRNETELRKATAAAGKVIDAHRKRLEAARQREAEWQKENDD